MPEIINHGKFVVDPAYDWDKNLAKDIELVQIFLEKKLAMVDQITDQTMQLICMFSLLDCLAQEQASYPQDSKKAFCDFILAHQKQCDYMECVEPITLYYHVEDCIEKTVLIPGFPEEKVISLESLGPLDMQPVRKAIDSGKAQEILYYVSQKASPSFAEKKRREHQLISLIYRMRSKAVHEMSGLGEIRHFLEYPIPQEPYYREFGREYVLNGDLVSDNIFELMIPNTFIRDILQDCVAGYLEECKRQKRFPFANNGMTRKHRLSWYDK